MASKGRIIKVPAEFGQPKHDHRILIVRSSKRLISRRIARKRHLERLAVRSCHVNMDRVTNTLDWSASIRLGGKRQRYWPDTTLTGVT
jgi:hypothetical protein